MRTRLMAAAAAAGLLMGGSAYAQGAGQGVDNHARPQAGASDKDRAPDQSPDGARGGMQNTDMQRTPDRGAMTTNRDRDDRSNDRMINGPARRGLETDSHDRIRTHMTRITEVQKKKIKEVLRGRPGPRLTHVTFRIGVGARVPRSVRFVALPPEIVAIYPEWEGYSYFETANEIVIVDPVSFAIVGVLPL